MKFKKTSLALLALIFVLIVALGSFSCTQPTTPTETPEPTETPKPTETPVEPIELIFNNPWPPTHWLAADVIDPLWIPEVEKITDGRVKIVVYHGGSLSKGAEVWEGTLAGRWDLGFWYPPYKEEFFPKTCLTTLPFVVPNYDKATELDQEFIPKKCLEEEWSEVVLCGIFSSDTYVLWSNEEVKTLDDLKGMKIRIPAKGWVDIIEAWGAVPVSISSSEMYSALDKGIVDAVFYPFTGGYGYKLQEVADYIIQVGSPTGSAPTSIIMNKESFEALPQDLQKIFAEEVPLFTHKMASDVIKQESGPMWEELEKTNNVYYLPKDEIAKWKDSVMFIWDKRVDDLNEKGLPGQKWMDEFQDTLKDMGLS